ncbi:MAG TPA: hypothetical protein VM305_04125 [Candidatus Limnocylindrales bacterium]|nr:hypothetical protein [Candidatus Limnocylindrales bacterium]
MGRIPWTRVNAVDEGLLANVGEKLISISRNEFDQAMRAWQRMRASVADNVRAYVDAVFDEAARQWQGKPESDFDPDALDSVIAQSVRGLQPRDLSPIVAPARDQDETLGNFLNESLDLLRETADIAAEH